MKNTNHIVADFNKVNRRILSLGIFFRDVLNVNYATDV